MTRGTRNRKKKIATVALAATVALTGCAVSGGLPAADENGPALSDMEPLVLKYSDSNVETAAHAIAMQTFMDTVTERTDGKITFESYFSGTLHAQDEALDALESGLTDITFITAQGAATELPVTGWEVTIAQAGIPSKYPASLLGGTPAQVALFQSSVIAAELAERDATTLATWSSLPNMLLCESAVSGPAELAARAVRTPGGPSNLDLEGLGMTTVSIPRSDVYEGLQRGIVSCDYGVASSFITGSTWDVATYLVPASFSTSAGATLLIRKSLIESLPEEVQDIMFEEQASLIAGIMRATLDRNIQLADEAADRGITFVNPAPFNSVLEENRETYIQAALDAPPAAISDADAFLSELEGLVDDWERLTAGRLDVQSVSPTTQEGWIDLFSSFEDVDWDEYAALVREYLAEHRQTSTG
ncbi:hypothetical protein [Salinibacterium sp. ZJ454]|uniref:hypothetical protein n=1 Tax=Salinibacterium sp. ZJ454 TaxID=2708339 RepID=UPI00141D8B9E|nr:hypothetical protein [Salinibacterium sp. ZJ454]